MYEPPSEEEEVDLREEEEEQARSSSSVATEEEPPSLPLTDPPALKKKRSLPPKQKQNEAPANRKKAKRKVVLSEDEEHTEVEEQAEEEKTTEIKAPEAPEARSQKPPKKKANYLGITEPDMPDDATVCFEVEAKHEFLRFLKAVQIVTSEPRFCIHTGQRSSFTGVTVNAVTDTGAIAVIAQLGCMVRCSKSFRRTTAERDPWDDDFVFNIPELLKLIQTTVNAQCRLQCYITCEADKFYVASLRSGLRRSLLWVPLFNKNPRHFDAPQLQYKFTLTMSALELSRELAAGSQMGITEVTLSVWQRRNNPNDKWMYVGQHGTSGTDRWFHSVTGSEKQAPGAPVALVVSDDTQLEQEDCNLPPLREMEECFCARVQHARLKEALQAFENQVMLQFSGEQPLILSTPASPSLCADSLVEDCGGVQFSYIIPPQEILEGNTQQIFDPHLWFRKE